MTKLKHAYHTDGFLPERREIFVFGSNLQGIHGAGAAQVARRAFGAVMGQGDGLVGRSYAIPTRTYDGSAPQGMRVTTLPLDIIIPRIENFCLFTRNNIHLMWWVTGVGCTNAGYTADQIAPHFSQAINCSFPLPWFEYLE